LQCWKQVRAQMAALSQPLAHTAQRPRQRLHHLQLAATGIPQRRPARELLRPRGEG
jgi:hypothetical protein